MATSTTGEEKRTEREKLRLIKGTGTPAEEREEEREVEKAK